MNPTPAQLEALQALASLTAIKGIAPSLAELAKTLGITKVSVHERLCGCMDKGLCTRQQKYAARTWQLTDAGRALVRDPLLSAAQAVCDRIQPRDARLCPGEQHAIRDLHMAVNARHAARRQPKAT